MAVVALLLNSLLPMMRPGGEQRMSVCMSAFLSLATLVTAQGAPAVTPGHWQVRYAQHGDQKPERTEAGYTPSWSITWVDATQPEVTWQDDDAGSYRGWLLIGRPVKTPDPLPAAISVSFDYITHCDLDPPKLERSGAVSVFVMTGEAWDALATEPRAAELFEGPSASGVLLSATVRGQGPDVHEWRDSGRVQLHSTSGSLAPGQELWAGVAWSGLHYNAREWGGFRDFEITMESEEDVGKRFWNAFDLARPELAELKDAVQAGDDAAATAALAAHLRRRERPAVANPVSPADDPIIARADEVLAGTYRLAGCPTYTFPGEIVWNADPFNYDQWAIALNRHSHWLSLASAYLKTHNEAYAVEWQDQLNGWTNAMPVLIGRRWIQGPYNQLGPAPLSLDAGIRMGQTWFQSFHVFRQSQSVTDATLVRFARSCWEHALYLMREENFKRGSNWGAMESNGLYHIGVMLPELKEARAWRETAVDRLMGELDNQVYPDGAQTELSPGYHGVSLRNFLGVLDLAKANDEDLAPEFAARLESMFDYYLRITMPDLRTPALNDSSRGGVQGWFRSGTRLFPHRDEFRWALTSREEGRPPDYTSVAMPYAGWVIMRSGWESDASYLLFDAGPFGTGHQHEDKLSIIVYAHGRELIADAGNYAYDDSQWRQYVLSTRAHSTVRVDGKGQNSRSDRSEYLAAAPATHGFVTNEHFDYARDTHTAGYGTPPDRSVVHRRRVLFVKPEYWLVVDDLASSDDAEHVADSQFAVNAPSATVSEDDGRFASDPEGDTAARIAIVPLDPTAMTVRIAKGETEPEVIGFIPEGFEKLRPIPTVVYSHRFHRASLIAYAIVPFRGEDCPVIDVECRGTGDGLRATLALRGGARHQIEIGQTGLTVVAEGRRFEATEDALAVGAEK